MINKNLVGSNQYVTKRAGKRAGMWFVYILVGIIGIIVISGTYLGKTTSVEVKKVSKSVASAVVATAKAERAPDRLDKAIEVMKDEVVARIKDLESRGLTSTSDGLLFTFDPTVSDKAKCSKIGGRMPIDCLSYGAYQMKIPTIQLWQKTLGDKVMSDREAMDLALNTGKATEFVKRVVFEISGSCWAWTAVANNRTEFDSKISLIRKLESL